MKSTAARLLRIILIVVAAGVFVIGGALAVVNLVVLPAALDRVIEAVRGRSVPAPAVTYGAAGYLPWSGVTVHDISIQPAGNTPNISVGKARLDISLPGLLSARSALPNLPFGELEELVRRADAPEAPYESLVFLRLLGARLENLGDVDLEISDLRTTGLLVDTATLRHADNTLLFRGRVATTEGSLEAGADVEAEIDYGRGRGRIDVAGVDTSSLGFAGTADLTAEVTFGDASTAPTMVEGGVVLRGFSADIPFVADEPVGPLDVVYEFNAMLDPYASVPNPAELPPLSRAGVLTDTPAMIHEALRDTTRVQGAVRVSRGKLVVNGVELGISGTAHGVYHHGEAGNGHFAAPQWLAIVAEIPKTDLDAIAEAIPDAIAGRLAEIRLTGRLALEMELRLVPAAIEAMDWRADVDLEEFAVRSIPGDINPYKLNGRFVHEIRDADLGLVRRVAIPAAEPASLEWMLTHSEHTAVQIAEMRARAAEAAARPLPASAEDGSTDGASTDGGGAPDQRYVRLDDMSRWVPAAVLTAEDGDFFFYPGVNPVTLKTAIARNLQAGEILYGASTITMQLAKMLFLDETRVFSRKLQEVFLVYLMENHVIVPKDRILEIYLNIAEFGPGVYGVHQAASYYFDKHPADLGVGEAVWLASILPAPTTYHRYYEAGAISPGWFERMKGYMETMLIRGRMSESEYLAAVEFAPIFAR